MTTATPGRPDNTEFAPYYAVYVDAVPDGDIVTVLRGDGDEMQAILAGMPESKGAHRYAADKWTIRDVIGHVIDAERVFAYRALRFARGDAAPLASFDQDVYVRTAGAGQRTLADLAAELRAVRDSTVALFASLPPDAWARRGIASEKTFSVRALAYIAAGHAHHHFRILRDRYLAA